MNKSWIHVIDAICTSESDQKKIIKNDEEHDTDEEYDIVIENVTYVD